MRQARFLFHPRWLLSHLLVVVLFVLFVIAGFWQLDRLDQRRDRNDLVGSRRTQPTVPIEDLLAPGDDGDAVGAARFRAVTATGTYDDDATVAVRNRTQDGVTGGWLLTPLVLEDGERVGVVRGFVGLGDDSDPLRTPPPEGEVTVTGVVADPGGFDGTAPRDAEKVVDQPGTLPGVVLAESSDPPEPAGTDAVDDPRDVEIMPVAPPELGEGPHLSYAVQWFIFATIALVGYPLILRRIIRQRAAEVARGTDDSDTGDDGAGPGADDAGPDDVDRELAQLLRDEG